jgi:hypothetical protein
MIDDLIGEIKALAAERKASPVDTIDGRPATAVRVDPDTIKEEGSTSYRLKGFNAPETAKVQGGILVPNQVAGDRTQEKIEALQKAGDYYTGVTTGKGGGYNRKELDIQNKVGESLGDAAVAAGIVKPNDFTTQKALKSQGAINSILSVFPSMADADPVLKMARDNAREELESKLPIRPKISVADEGLYAAMKGLVGIKAVKAQEEEITRLEGHLANPALPADVRAKMTKELDDAKRLLFIAATAPDVVGGVDVRRPDRTIMNRAYDNIDVALENGWLNTVKALHGITELVATDNGWSELAARARSGSNRIKFEQGQLPDTISVKDIRTDNSWDTITDTATWISSIAAGSVPMLSVMMASGMAASAIPGVGPVVAGGLSTVPGSILYTGQYYADQPDDKKNSALAIMTGVPSGVLDKLGLEGMFGKSVFVAADRAMLQQALISQGKAASKEAADKLLKDATRSELMEAAKWSAQFAENQYKSNAARIAATRNVMTAMGAEAGTETIQQYLEMAAGSGEFNRNFEYNKGFKDQLIEAGLGGGVLGGGINMMVEGVNAAKWHSLADAQRIVQNQLDDAQAFRSRQRNFAGQQLEPGDMRGVASTIEAVEALNSHVMEGDTPLVPLADMESADGNWNGFKAAVSDPVRLLRGIAGTIMRSFRKADGSLKLYMPILKSILAPGTLTGDHAEGFRQRFIGAWTTPNNDDLATSLNTNKKKANEMLKEAWQAAWSKGAKLPPTNNDNVVLQNWKDRVDKATAEVSAISDKLGFPNTISKDLDTVFEDSVIDRKKIASNSQRIVEALVAAGSTREQAQQTVDLLVSGNPSEMRGAKKWLSDHGIFKDRTLNDLFEPNVVDAFEQFKHNTATRITKEFYLGADGKNLAKLLQLARANGEFNSEAEYLDAVRNVKDWYAIFNGNYNSLAAHPTVEKTLAWATTLTMLASLGKAMFSSVPESAIAILGTPGEKVAEQVKANMKEFLRELKSDVNNGISWSTSMAGLAWARNVPTERGRIKLAELQARYDALNERLGNNPDDPKLNADLAALAKDIKKFHKKFLGRSLFERLGFNDSGYNTQAKYETDSGKVKEWMKWFAATVGLRAMTDSTRIAALSVAADIMNSKFLTLLAIPKGDRAAAFDSGQGMTKEQFQNFKELEAWGVDVPTTVALLDSMDGTSVEKMQTLMSPEQDNVPPGDNMRILRNNLDIGLTNMVNSKITQPSSWNLPKYYHDPRFRIFTTMTRFMATMTANVLPRLYRDYIKNGSVGMRYQAFSAIVSAMILGAIMNALKDELAYGDENPYVKSTGKKIQRAISASGALGRLDSAVEFVSPMYPQNSVSPVKSPFKYSYNALKDLAPPIGWADKVASGVYRVANDDVPGGVSKLARAAPIIGSFPIVANELKNKLKE